MHPCCPNPIAFPRNVLVPNITSQSKCNPVPKMGTVGIGTSEVTIGEINISNDMSGTTTTINGNAVITSLTANLTTGSTAVTQPIGNNSTKIATTAYVDASMTGHAQLASANTFTNTNTFHGIKTGSITSLLPSGSIAIAGDQVGGSVSIGTTTTSVTTNGTTLKQVVPLLGGGVMETIVGNTTTSSLSTTFNRKRLTTSVTNPIACYTITSPAQWTTQYFELVVSGSNNDRGGYSYKGCFGIDHNQFNVVSPSSVNTLFYYGPGVNPPITSVPPVISFTVSGFTATLNVNTSAGSIDQNFVTTLTAYPTLYLDNFLQGYIITAI